MKTKNFYFVFNRNFLKLFEKHLNLELDCIRQSKILVFDKSIGDYLNKKYGVECLNHEKFISAEELEKITKEAILWIHQWSNSKISYHNSITEYYAYGRTSLWWISGYLYLCRDFIYIISYQKIIQKILEIEKFDQIIIPDIKNLPTLTTQLPLTDYTTPYRVLYNYCHEKKLNFELLPLGTLFKGEWFVKVISNRFKSFIFSNFYLGLTDWIRHIISKRRVKFLPRFSESKKIYSSIIISPSRNWGPVFNLENGQRIMGDQKLAYLYQKLAKKNRYQVIGIDCNSPHINENFMLKQKMTNDPFLTWVALEYFWEPKLWFVSRKSMRMYKRAANQLLKDEQFKKSFHYNNIPFFSLMSSRLSFVLKTFLPYGVTKILLYEKLINKMKPDLFFISYETGLHGRACLNAALKHNIPTIAIQHGRIFASHPQYIYPGVSTRKNPNLSYPPITDKTCVYGEHFKNILTRGSAYPEENINVTGQILTDILTFKERLYDKNKFIKSLSLNPDKPLLSLMSQNLDPQSDYERLFQIPCVALNDLPEVQFLIKPHQHENIKQVRSLVEKYSTKSDQVKIIRDVALYEVLHASDIIVTGNSTVGLESMIFEKPLITIEGFKFSMGYAESGASIGITSAKEMKLAVEKILKNNSMRRQLLDKSQSFLQHHLYKIDGKVSERIIQVGRDLLHQNK